jgi:hypothetical protein
VCTALRRAEGSSEVVQTVGGQSYIRLKVLGLLIKITQPNAVEGMKNYKTV